MSTHSHDWKTLESALLRVGEFLQKPARLVLIGSSVGMFYGQPGRMTEDIDVWSPTSRVDLADIAQACEKAGITFDPQGLDVAGDGLYLQMVKPGFCNVGKWKDENFMLHSGKLTVAHPPAEHIVASKLARCTDADLEDIVYLMQRLDISMESVHAAIATLKPRAQEMANENLVMLEVHASLAAQAANFESKKASVTAPAKCPTSTPPAAASRRAAHP
jgi:hypothetical protein